MGQDGLVPEETSCPTRGMDRGRRAVGDGKGRHFATCERRGIPVRRNCPDEPRVDRHIFGLAGIRFPGHPGKGLAEVRGEALIPWATWPQRCRNAWRDGAYGHLHQSGFCQHVPASSAADALLSPAGITDSLPTSRILAKNPNDRTLVMNIPPLGAPPLLPPDRTDALMVKAAEMEAAFLAEMLAHSGLGERQGAFGGGAGEAQFASFLRQEQARLMVETGGIGLAEVIFRTMVEGSHGAP
jgi:peptidoglycan hydrolase FlgJ